VKLELRVSEWNEEGNEVRCGWAGAGWCPDLVWLSGWGVALVLSFGGVKCRVADLSRGKMRKNGRKSACGGAWVHGGA
jgi:hypothetical protein